MNAFLSRLRILVRLSGDSVSPIPPSENHQRSNNEHDIEKLCENSAHANRYALKHSTGVSGDAFYVSNELIYYEVVRRG